MTNELDIAPAQLQRLDKGTAGPQQAVLPCGCQLDQCLWLLTERIMAVVLCPLVCASAEACHGFHVTSSLILCLSFQGCNVYRLGRSWSYLQLTRFQLFCAQAHDGLTLIDSHQMPFVGATHKVDKNASKSCKVAIIRRRVKVCTFEKTIFRDTDLQVQRHCTHRLCPSCRCQLRLQVTVCLVASQRNTPVNKGPC